MRMCIRQELGFLSGRLITTCYEEMTTQLNEHIVTCFCLEMMRDGYYCGTILCIERLEAKVAPLVLDSGIHSMRLILASLIPRALDDRRMVENYEFF